jgi:hypothetical protein
MKAQNSCGRCSTVNKGQSILQELDNMRRSVDTEALSERANAASKRARETGEPGDHQRAAELHRMCADEHGKAGLAAFGLEERDSARDDHWTKQFRTNQRRTSRYERDTEVAEFMAHQNPISILANERHEEFASRRFDDSFSENSVSDFDDDVTALAPKPMDWEAISRANRRQ